MKIEHIALYVNDLSKSRCFFEKYFGAEACELYHNKATGFMSYFLSFEDGARLEIMTHPQTEDIEKVLKRTGFAHIAFSVGSREKVDTLTRTMQNDGYTVISQPRVTGDGYYESCVLDSEGNQIEITE